MKRLLISAALLSCALVAFQLILMQVFSIVQWYHFAYMVIAVALLGFGVSGTVLALGRSWFLDRASLLLPLLMMLCGLLLTIALPIVQLAPVRFDAYLLFVEGKHVVRLMLTYLVLFLPFLLGALAIGLLFLRYPEAAGKCYAANLLGSGVGGVAGLWMLWLVPAQQATAVVGLLAGGAGILLLSRNEKALWGVGGIGVLITLFFFFSPPTLLPSEYKALSRTLTLPHATVVAERTSPFGLVQVVSSPLLRYAPGLSLAYKGVVPSYDVVFNNGDWFGPIARWRKSDTTSIEDFTTLALPYVIDDRHRVLVLQARTGWFATHALSRGASHVTIVEPHGEVLDLLMHECAALSDSLLLHPAVRVHPLDPRTYLRTDTARFDLILLPLLDAFGGTGGIYALQEQYLLTKEAFEEMWHRLTPGGTISITSYMDQPIRHPLRALTTIAAMLDDAGIVNPKEHLVAIRSWGTVTFVVKKTPLTREEVERVQTFCERMGFDPLLLPTGTPLERNKHNVLYDRSFFGLVDGILTARRKAIIEQYEFRIAPTTDERPYFSQFLRWKSVPHLREMFGGPSLPFLELGSFLIALTLVQIAALALLLVVVPLVRMRVTGVSKGRVFFYFAALGFGYMFIEMLAIQRFVLYLGEPLFAAATVISAMLVFSGIGSAVSTRIVARPAVLRRVTIGVAVLVLVSTVVIHLLMQHTFTLSSPLKFLLACGMIAPCAFVMGIPFPLGMRSFAALHPHAPAWGWGINGCASVIAAPLATLLALEAGFSWVMAAAAAMYVVASAAVKE
ncbi:MAG: spermidine synthase-like protein [Ignavibacteria bacterium]